MKSPEELRSLIHEVVPGLPLTALELLEELGTIGEEAELTQELAHALALVHRSTPEPTLSDDFADSLMAALPPGPPPAAGEAAAEPEPSAPATLDSAAPSSTHGSPWAGFAASFLIGVGLTTAWGWIDTAEVAPLTPERAARSHGAQQGPVEPSSPAPAEEAPAGEAPSEQAPTEQAPPADETPDEELGNGIVEAGQKPRATPVDPALARLANEGDPVQSYLARASIVFEALERLDPKDPRVSRALALHLERSELLEQGERLLVAIEYQPSGDRLRPLIRGAQVVLRKVRHVPMPSTPDASPSPDSAGTSLSAIRQEVRHTGLLAACRQLLATPEPDPEPSEAAGETRDL